MNRSFFVPKSIMSLLAAVLCLSSTGLAAQEAAPDEVVVRPDAAQVEPDQVPVTQFSDMAYSLYFHYFWEAIDKEGMPRELLSQGGSVVRHYAAFRAATWTGRSLHARYMHYDRRLFTAVGRSYLNEIGLEREPVFALLAYELGYGYQSNPSRSYASPDDIRPIAAAIVEGDYPLIVKAHAIALLRESLLSRGVARNEALRLEAESVHTSLTDYIFTIIDQGLGDLPEGVDEQMIFSVLLGMLSDDNAAWPNRSKEFYHLSYADLGRRLSHENDPAYPWAALLFQAGFHNVCFHYMTNGWVDPNERGRYIGYTRAEHREACQDLLDRAWQLHPEYPQSAFIAMGVNYFDSEAFEMWFRRAHESNGPVLPGIYGLYRDRLFQYRRDDDIDTALQYAYEVVDGGRFDTPITAQFYYTLQAIKRATRRADYLQDEQFFDYLTRYCNGSAAQEFDYFGEDYWQSVLAVGALLTGREELGLQMIRDLGDRFNQTAPREIAISEAEFQQRLNDLGIELP